MASKMTFLLGVTLEVAFWRWIIRLTVHPLRWDRPIWYGDVLYGGFGPFSVEVDEV